MSPISKNERRHVYEQAVREFDEATAAHHADVALHPDLVNRLEQANFNFDLIEAAMEAGGVELHEYDAANEEWGEAQNALDAATRNTLNRVIGARQRVYATYDDYIA